MRTVKHEPFSYSYAITLANTVIQFFYDETDNFDDFWDDKINEIAQKLIKPEKESLLHLYINWINDMFEDEVKSVLDNVDPTDFKATFDFMESTLNQLGEKSKKSMYPNYSAINKCNYCTKCRSCKKFQKYINWLKDKNLEYKPQLIHSTFHVLMLDKAFLKDFHESIAKAIQYEKETLHNLYPKIIKKNGIIKRTNWPIWLKRGIFFRDKGVCTICRNPLSGDLFQGINPDMDHIVPLAKYGSNDSSNIQILCNICNNKKSYHSSATSSIDIPLWNI